MVAVSLTAMPLSLYVHLPWCVRKCPYCDFNSHALRGELPETDYVDALLRDLEEELAWLPQSTPLVSIFIGGGTPSLFSADALERLLSGIRRRTAWQSAIEITLEANPGTVEQQRFRDYRAIGINRLSLGIQSLNDRHLQALGRIHGRAEALRAVETAQLTGFDNINLDLMYGLPDQVLDEALADLQTVIDLAPAHISHYQLTLEPNTLFHRHPPDLPDDDMLWVMQEQSQNRLAEHGYRHYEISAYSRTDSHCRHNLNYWEFGDYLGIGAGAHGKRTDTATGTVWRTRKRKHPQDFLRHAGQQAAIGAREPVHEADLVFEFMLNRLRLRTGFPMALFTSRTGLPVERVRPLLERAQARGLLVIDRNLVTTTTLGRRFLNDLLEIFLPDEAEPERYDHVGVGHDQLPVLR